MSILKIYPKRDSDGKVKSVTVIFDRRILIEYEANPALQPVEQYRRHLTKPLFSRDDVYIPSGWYQQIIKRVSAIFKENAKKKKAKIQRNLFEN